MCLKCQSPPPPLRYCKPPSHVKPIQWLMASQRQHHVHDMIPYITHRQPDQRENNALVSNHVVCQLHFLLRVSISVIRGTPRMGDVGYVGTVRMRMRLRVAFVMFCRMGRFCSFLVSFYTSLLGCFFLSLPSLFSLYVCSARVELRFACLSGIEAEVTLKPKCIEPQCVGLDWAKEIAHSFAVLGIEYFCLQQEGYLRRERRRRRRDISF